MADQIENPEETWVDATTTFLEASAADLGELYAPQVKTMRHLARQLDAFTETPAPAALVAEYSRIHRWLLNKLGGGRGAQDDSGPSIMDMLPGLGLFE